MVDDLTDGAQAAGQQATEGFSPEEYTAVLDQLAAATGVELALREEAGARASCAAVRSRGRKTGWVVTTPDTTGQAPERAVQAAAELIGRIMRVEQDNTDLAAELADRTRETDFLYEMSRQVSALTDEDDICRFVIREASRRLQCDRASLMLVDPETQTLTIRAAVGLREEIFEKVSVLPGEGISGRVFESGQPVVVNGGDPMPSDRIGARELEGWDCFLSVPLKTTFQDGEEEVVLGVINLTRKRGGQAFTPGDCKLVSTVAVTTAAKIHNCRLLAAEQQRRRLQHEMEVAARIQSRLYPEGPFAVGKLRAAGCSRPAKHVGGDLFDYWTIGDRTCFVVGDVSGHDLGASLMAAAMRSVIRAEASHAKSVRDLMTRVNQSLYHDLARAELFITAFYGEVRLDSGEFTFCRAGHPLPLYVHSQRREWLDTDGMLFGLTTKADYEQKSVRLNEGDTVVLYTDGLMEATDPEGHQFGQEGLQRAVIEALAEPPAKLARRVVDAATDHLGKCPVMDDMTTLVMRYG